MNVEVLPDIPESPVSSLDVTPESRDSPLPEMPPRGLTLNVPVEEIVKTVAAEIGITDVPKIEDLPTITVTLDERKCIPSIIERVRKFLQNLRISLSTPTGKTL